MSSIGGLPGGSSNLQPLVESSKTATQDESATPTGLQTPVAAEGIRVSLSGAGIKKAAEFGANRDIEESGLPENIQQILKMIRKLKQQIAEKMAQIQAVMADRRLTPEQARAKAGTLQSAIATLTSGLITANGALSKAMKVAGLSPEQLLKAASLMMKS
jgi:hypothetical protein